MSSITSQQLWQHIELGSNGMLSLRPEFMSCERDYPRGSPFVSTEGSTEEI